MNEETLEQCPKCKGTGSDRACQPCEYCRGEGSIEHDSDCEYSGGLEHCGCEDLRAEAAADEADDAPEPRRVTPGFVRVGEP